MDNYFYVHAILLMIFEVSAQTLFKKYYIEMNIEKTAVLVMGLLLYSLSGIFVFKLLQYGSLGIVNVIWHILHFLSLFLVGRVIFGEKYTTKQVFACLLAFCSLYLFMTEEMDDR